MLNSQGQSTSLISVAASLAFAALVIVNLEEAWENHKFRVHVSNVLAEAELSAPLSVTLNAENGLPLDLGWRQTKPSIDDGLVSISAETGIITVSLGAEVDSGKRNLKLVPISNNNVLKVTDGLVAKSLDWSKVKWVCTSSDSKYSFNIPEEGRGSLPSRFAPARCR
jgi:hypothetical protein